MSTEERREYIVKHWRFKTDEQLVADLNTTIWNVRKDLVLYNFKRVKGTKIERHKIAYVIEMVVNGYSHAEIKRIAFIDCHQVKSIIKYYYTKITKTNKTETLILQSKI